ncbi:hypothetical protein Tco_1482752 [Tanacetum coccineum]
MKGQDNPLIPNPHPHLLNSTIKKPIIVPSSYQPKKTHKPRTAIRTTEISQSSRPINLVADETVYKEWEDRMERAATTASSLDAEQDSGNINRTQSMATLNESFPQGTDSGSGPSPTIYTSCIEQFWATAKAKMVNGERQLQALVDKKKVIITETSIRSDLHLEDSGGTDCLPTATIFEEMARMGRKQKKTTTVPHPSDSTTDVPNEEFMPTHSNDPLLSGEDRLKLTDLMDMCTKLSERFLDLEHTKTAQAQEITNLKLRVKKLEKKAGLRTHKFKRLYKVGVTQRIEYSDDESLGAQEDASNQGMSIEDINKDAKVSLVDETQGRSDDVEMFDTYTLIGNEVFAENDMIEKDQDVILKEVSTVAPSTIAVPPPDITKSTATTAPSTIPKAKGITFRYASESTTRTPTSVSSSSIKDKGKAKMDEPEVPLKKKDQIALDEEMARNLEA